MKTQNSSVRDFPAAKWFASGSSIQRFVAWPAGDLEYECTPALHFGLNKADMGSWIPAANPAGLRIGCVVSLLCRSGMAVEA